MKKMVLLIIMLAIFFAVGCKADVTSEKLLIASSIVPENSFVEAVGKDKIDTITMIPPGNSPSNYGPTPKEMALLEEADIYFSIGVNAETENILPSVLENEKTKLVRLDERVESLYPPRFFGNPEEEHGNSGTEEDSHEHEGRDPHIWMSPKRVIEITKIIMAELSEIDPANKEFYNENGMEYIKQVEKLDSDILEVANKNPGKLFIIYHPSLGYLADDYGFKMVEIENDGKDATIEGLKAVIDLAKSKNIKTVFYQSEFDGKQAEILANEIGGEAVMIEPLSPDYIENLRKIVQLIVEQ